MIDSPHAVRWARRTIKSQMNLLDYTRWHWTIDANQTLCGRPITLANPGGTFLPETDGCETAVTCSRCRKKMEVRK